MIYYVSPTFYYCGVHRRVHDSFCFFCGRERRVRHPLGLGLLVSVAPEAKVAHTEAHRRNAQGAHDEGHSQVAPLGSLTRARQSCVAAVADEAAQVCGAAPDTCLPWMASVAPDVDKAAGEARSEAAQVTGGGRAVLVAVGRAGGVLPRSCSLLATELPPVSLRRYSQRICAGRWRT